MVENVIGALLLTSGLSLALAVGAVAPRPGGPRREPHPPRRPGHHLDRRRPAGFGRRPGGTVGLAGLAARRGWDLDNLVAPVVSTLGDVLTLPALWLATHLIGHGAPRSSVIGWLLVAATSPSAPTAWSAAARSCAPCAASPGRCWSAPGRCRLAGRPGHRAPADRLVDAPALLILVPAFVSSAGRLGRRAVGPGRPPGCTSAPGEPPDRPTAPPGGPGDPRRAGRAGDGLQRRRRPGRRRTGRARGARPPGLLATTLSPAPAPWPSPSPSPTLSGVAPFRLRLDPDTYGIPVVTSSVDLVGVALLTTVAVALGVVA